MTLLIIAITLGIYSIHHHFSVKEKNFLIKEKKEEAKFIRKMEEFSFLISEEGIQAMHNVESLCNELNIKTEDDDNEVFHNYLYINFLYYLWIYNL
jgi:hypothetical protein